jgi:DNA repair protein RecN (Recombination protein N)
LLRSLYVRDYALIEELDVEFDAGLNIITGETGAGKSILIGALQMILGTRASTDTIRSGAKKAIIEGVFEGVRSEVIRSILADNSIDEQPAIILRREITSTQSRGFINDTPATIQVMRDVASNLIDLHGQHEHQSLLDVSRHLELLDSFGDLDALRGAYESEYRAVTELVRERSALQSSQQEMEQKKELYEFQIREIDRISPVAGEEEELDAERRLLENAERLYASTSDLYSRMYEGDHAVHDELVTIRDELEDLAQIDSQFEEMLKEIASATIIVSEAA